MIWADAMAETLERLARASTSPPGQHLTAGPAPDRRAST